MEKYMKEQYGSWRYVLITQHLGGHVTWSTWSSKTAFPTWETFQKQTGTKKIKLNFSITK